MIFLLKILWGFSITSRIKCRILSRANTSFIACPFSDSPSSLTKSPRVMCNTRASTWLGLVPRHCPVWRGVSDVLELIFWPPWEGPPFPSSACFSHPHPTGCLLHLPSTYPSTPTTHHRRSAWWIHPRRQICVVTFFTLTGLLQLPRG